MATWPAKTDYATGDVLSATNMNDIGNGLNDLYGESFTNNFYAGKNKIINGDFGINQRAFTSTTTTGTYGFDRFFLDTSDGTATYSAQTFTPGTAPVAGYESTNFARIVTTGQTLVSAQTRLSQAIEDVRTFANQTVIVSFWAKAASGTPKIAVELAQSFGAGGSTGVNNTIGQATISTSWARYSVTGSVATINGKTIGTGSALILRLFVSAGSNFDSRTGSMGIQSNTFDFWGVQVEAGSTATPFQTSTGTIQGELAACQRYYVRLGGDSLYQPLSTWASAYSTTAIDTIPVPLAVTMRIVPTSLDYSTLAISDGTTVTAGTGTWSFGGSNGKQIIHMKYVHGSAVLTQYRSYCIVANNSTSAYLGFSAEL